MTADQHHTQKVSYTGVTVKQIREKKGLKAKDVYTGIVSRSSYFRFENGEHDTTVSNLFAFLDRLQVGVAEFSVELATQWPQMLPCVERNHSALGMLSQTQLDQLVVEFRANYDKTHTLGDYHNILKIELYQEYQRTQHISETAENLKILSTYLFDIEEWYQYELLLFQSICKLLPCETIDALLPRVTKVEKRTASGAAKTTAVEVMNTVILTTLSKRDYRYFKKFVQLAQQMAVPETALLDGIYFAMYQDFIAYRQGEGDLVLIDDARQLVKLAGKVVRFEEGQRMKRYEQALENWLI